MESEFAGGTVANTLHNYSVLSDSRSILLGVMSEQISVGSYAYRYLCNTSSRVDLDHLQPVQGPIGRCFTFVSQDGDRSFGISPGAMNRLTQDHIPESVITGAVALVISAYLVRGEEGDTMKARITSYNVCYTKLLRCISSRPPACRCSLQPLRQYKTSLLSDSRLRVL